MLLAQLRRHFDGMLGDQLETNGRTTAPESSHRLDQQLVIPVPVAAGPEHEVGLGVSIAVPELRVNTEVEQMQTIAVHTPISGQDIELCRGQRPDCFRPTKRWYGERASAATDGSIWLGNPDDSHSHSGLPRQRASKRRRNPRPLVPTQGGVAGTTLAAKGRLDELEAARQASRRAFQELRRP
jgi:hypothetical protein